MPGDIPYYALFSELISKRLDDASLSHQGRLLIGQKLAEFGDSRSGVGVKGGLPDIEWIEIPGGKINLDDVDDVFQVKPFKIAKYLVTNAQFESFINAEDGYRNRKWWKNIEQSSQAEKPSWQEANSPRETISWFEAIAFCRWLSHQTKSTIRLPTEWEWQQAATSGDSTREYPWPGEWDTNRCNGMESGLKRTISVGMYSRGSTRQGVMDMAGNVWEWCLNTYAQPEVPTSLSIDKSNTQRVIRGGSWNNYSNNLRVANRNSFFASNRSINVGFRLVLNIP
jgi:formylglycine-generating enzyme required for sulfatase activity